LQAQKKVSTVNAAPSAIDTGTIRSSVTPMLWATAMSSSNMMRQPAGQRATTGPLRPVSSATVKMG
jgi:hypothetical protein